MRIDKRDVAVVIINWREEHTVKQTVENLRNESRVNLILIVDSGSGNPEFSRLRALRESNPRLEITGFARNKGVSHSRNLGIQYVEANNRYNKRINSSMETKYVFFIDGDIVYVPGTIELYRSYIDVLPDAVCLGHNNMERVMQTGINGTTNQDEADQVCPIINHFLGCDYPMAWTQYGLFTLEFLLGHPFVTEGPFGEAGHGYEDDWMFSEIEAEGKHCYYINVPLYYHDANKGLRNLNEDGTPTQGNERQMVYYNKWGHYGFVHRLRTGQHKHVYPVTAG